MGQFISPEFDRTISCPEAETTGEFLASNFEQLDQIAKDSGLTPPISTFGDKREVPEDFDGDPDELGEVMGPRMDWYDSRDGVKALKDFLGALSSRPDLRQGLDDFEAVVEELEDLMIQLEAAATAGARFRLQLS
jgi:hypothetical protein